MSLWTIAWRSIQRRAVASTLTALSMAFGVCLVVAVLLVSGVLSESFQSNSRLGYNLVVGAKGGRLQLILNTVYYLSKPVGNIPYDYYLEFLDADEVQAELPDEQIEQLIEVRQRRLTEAERQKLAGLEPDEQRRELLKGKFADQTFLAIPIALGDYYKEYRVVGTTPRLFNELVYDVDNDRKFRFSRGENFQTHSDKHGYFEAVVGASVAREQGLKLGDPIVPSHGSTEEEGGRAHAHDPFHVVGILAPSGTPNDRAVFVNIEGFLLMDDHALPLDEVAPEFLKQDEEDLHQHDEPMTAHGDEESHEDAGQESAAGDEDADPHAHECDHDHHGHECHGPLPLARREVTALLVRNQPMRIGDSEDDDGGVFNARTMHRNINKGPIAQAVLPVAEITELLMTFVNPLRWLLLAITVMICIVSGIGILVSIYNSMSDRRHEIAVMRALGASRGTVMTIVLLEALMLALGGGIIGWLGGHAAIGLASPWILARSGVTISGFDLAPSVLTLPVLNLGVSAELLLVPGLIVLAVAVGLLPAVAAYRTDVAKSLGSV